MEGILEIDELLDFGTSIFFPEDGPDKLCLYGCGTQQAPRSVPTILSNAGKNIRECDKANTSTKHHIRK